jgi:hypothetical protein
VSVAVRRLTYLTVIVAIMPLSGWAGTYAAWRAVLGDDVGGALAVFFDLQVETWSFLVLFAPILDLVYGLHRAPDGWAFAPRDAVVRATVAGALVVLVVVCSAERALREAGALALPDDIAASTAHYLRRAVEGVLTALGLVLFLELLRPGRLADRLRRAHVARS